MNLLRGNCSKPRDFASGYFGITSTVTPATFLIVTSLVVFIILSGLACGGPTPAETLPPHIRTLTPTPTDTPSPTVIPTPTPTLFPPVMLTGPESGSEFDGGSEVTLRWSYPYALQAGEYYRLRVQAEGQNISVFYHSEDHFTLPAFPSGKYEWAVAIVRSTGEDRYELVSQESDWYGFEIAPPKPVVHSISPENTVRGRGAQVVVSGENFTRSLTIVIGVPLPTTFMDPGTMTATIPMTLAAAKYPVLVQDATGASISSAPSTVFFTVETPPPVPRATPKPTPRSYPPIELLGIDVIASNVTLKWTWSQTLAADEWFAVRVGIGEPHSKTWTKEQRYTFSLTEAGEYTWEIAVCRGDPAAVHCSSLDGTELVVSRREVFRIGGDSTEPTIIPP